MKIPVVDKCCCFGVETGAFIIGSLDLFSSVIMGIRLILSIISPVSEDSQSPVWLIIIFSLILLSRIVMAALLLVGINKKIPAYIESWLCFSLILLILGAIYFIISIVSIISAGFADAALYIICVALLSCVGNIYMMIVVYSYKKMITPEPSIEIALTI